MPRQLPWSSGKGSRTQVLPPTSRLHDPKPKARRRDASDDESHDQLSKRPLRELSSSPVAPPSPLKETYMKEGLGADDIWVMVEDEFLDTAKLFTRHLHRAEYQRLKLRAKAENAARINSISRPITDKETVTPDLARRLKTEARDLKQQAATSKLSKFESVESDDEDAPWMREPHLNKLMRRPPQMARDLSRAVGFRSKTRAAAGYTKARSLSPVQYAPKRGRDSIKDRSSMAGLAQELGIVPEDSEHSDDLDGPGYRSTSRIFPARPSSPIKHSSLAKKTSANRLGSSSLGGSKSERSNRSGHVCEPASRTSTSTSTQQSVRASSHSSRTESSFDIGSSSTSRPRSIRKPASKIKEKNEQKKTIALDEIPTFLF